MALRESQKLYTVEEFEEIAALPENEERRLELDDGVIIEMGSSSVRNTITGVRISRILDTFADENQLGTVTGSDGGYVLGPKRVRRPDIGFYSNSHNYKPTGVDIPFAPDLAVEVVSPREDALKKAREYIEAGTKLVWIVYAEEKVIVVLTATFGVNFEARQLSISDTLDGGDVLPGFSVPVAKMFPVP